MDNPLPALALSNSSPTTARIATRKRSRSTVEIFTLSPLASDTKRARIGIQELTTDPNPIPKPLFPALSRASSSSGPETESPGGEVYSSSDAASSENNEDDDDDDDENSTSSSSDDESSGGAAVDDGYDSDTESGSTSTSSSSSSSEGDSSDEDEGGGGSSRSATVGFPSPERLRTISAANFATSTAGAPSALAKRLDAFLPRMKVANAQLEDEVKKDGGLSKRNIEHVDENAQYIEMNLGLGVLEEKPTDAATASHESDNDGDESEAGSGKSWTKGRSKKHDTMATLMGRKGGKKPDIQVVDEK